MRYFYDCEFDDNGRTIDLISIGIVAEDGREFYAFSSEFDPEKCNDWVKANVLPKLPPWSPENDERWMSRPEIAHRLMWFLQPHALHDEDAALDREGYSCAPGRPCLRCGAPIFTREVPIHTRTREQAINLGSGVDDRGRYWRTPCPKAEPELCGFYSAYDHVALCQLYGPLVNRPEGWPMFTMDVNQWRRQLGLPREALPPDPEGEHDALLDARWTRDAWQALAAKATQEEQISIEDVARFAARLIKNWEPASHPYVEAANILKTINRWPPTPDELKGAL